MLTLIHQQEDPLKPSQQSSQSTNVSGNNASHDITGFDETGSELTELSESSESSSDDSDDCHNDVAGEPSKESNIHPSLRDPQRPMTPPRFISGDKGLLMNEAAVGKMRSGQSREERGQRSGPRNEP